MRIPWGYTNKSEISHVMCQRVGDRLPQSARHLISSYSFQIYFRWSGHHLPYLRKNHSNGAATKNHKKNAITI